AGLNMKDNDYVTIHLVDPKIVLPYEIPDNVYKSAAAALSALRSEHKPKKFKESPASKQQSSAKPKPVPVKPSPVNPIIERPVAVPVMVAVPVPAPVTRNTTTTTTPTSGTQRPPTQR